MSKNQNQFKVSLPPFIRQAVADISEKIGCSQAAYIRMCVKKDVDERGYKRKIEDKKS